MERRRPTWIARIAALGVALFCALFFLQHGPSRLCARDAASWYAGDAEVASALAQSVGQWAQRVDADEFDTGSARFDGEWMFGTRMMAAMGLGQAQLEYGSSFGGPSMRTVMHGLLAPEARAFDTSPWRSDALDTLDAGGALDRGHAAYLGYLNLTLSLLGRVEPDDEEHRELGDRITEALARRIERSPTLLIETYPGEVYPVDNAAAIASIALHDEVSGRPRRNLVDRWVRAARDHFIDPHTGLLVQAVARRDARVIDGPRGSGTALASYFLSFADEGLSRELHLAVRHELYDEVLGFGVVSEYPASHAGGRGDIDSGPIAFGYGVSATGFSLATSRIHGDRRMFERLYATFHLFGAPVDVEARRTHIAGGALGDAIALAMLTARPAGAAR